MGQPLLVGLSHKNAALETRERLALLPPQALYERLAREGCREAVILSTCNRFEVYAFDAESRPGAWVAGLLGELCGQELEGQLYVKEGAEAVRHLFEVAAGLDSLVVGETEILGQVKAAYEAARAGGMTDKRTNVLFQRALYTGKKARNETAIAVGQTSVASVAVQLAETIFGDLRESRALVLGAGAMAELTARHLLSKKVSRLTIANRTWERGKALADALKASAVPWEDFETELAGADIVLCSTGSERPVVGRGAVEAAMGRRAGRSLFLIDIAMPRDVDEAVHGLEHVYLYRLNDLETIVADNLKNRGGEVARARALARAKADELSSWLGSLSAGREISLRHSDAAAI